MARPSLTWTYDFAYLFASFDLGELNERMKTHTFLFSRGIYTAEGTIVTMEGAYGGSLWSVKTPLLANHVMTQCRRLFAYSDSMKFLYYSARGQVCPLVYARSAWVLHDRPPQDSDWVTSMINYQGRNVEDRDKFSLRSHMNDKKPDPTWDHAKCRVNTDEHQREKFIS